MNRISIALVFLAWLLAGCDTPAPESAGPEPQAVSEYRVVIELPEVELPVRMHLAPDGSEAWFENGVERVVVPRVESTDSGYRLEFPAFGNSVLLEREGEGFRGTLTLQKRGYQQVMPLSAVPDPGYRFAPDPQPEADFTGRWAVAFIEPDGEQAAAVGEFDQRGNEVSGTFLTPTGDYRYLAGNVDGRTMYLSTFDGAHAFVFEARMNDDGSLEGDFWSGTKWHQQWTAARDFDAALPDAYSLTFIKDGYEGLEFTFPDLDGKPISLDDEKYRGKVVLVSLAGSWCPNCGDEMAYLSGVYERYRDQGLEIICLLYEHFEDFERAAQQGRALKEKYDIGFDVLVAGISDKTAAAETLPMLNHVLAYPTLIFVDRRGEVRRIHTGFSGPGTGEHFEEFKRKFTSELESLLAEPSVQAGP